MLEAALRAKRARQAEVDRDATVRAEAERLAQAIRYAEELALKSVSVQEHHRAQEAARFLKAAHEAEHAKVHEVVDRADLFRREEVLLDARRGGAALAVVLADAQKLAKNALAAGDA